PGSPVCGYIYQFGNVTTPQTVPSSYESSQDRRNDWSFYADNTWSPNDKLKLEGGLRVDAVNYQIPTPTIDPATCTSLYLPQYVTNPDGTLKTVPSTNPNTQTFYTNPVTGAAAVTPLGTCPVAIFPQFDNRSKKPIIPEPILSATYMLGPNDSIRASWGRSVEFANLASIDFSATPGYFNGPNGAFLKIPGYGINCGANADQACVNYAEQLYWDNAQTTAGPVPLMPVRPTVYTNVDFSWEHQFTRGILNGVAFKVTPWYRKAHDEIALVSTVKIVGGIPLTNPTTGALIFNPPVANNLGLSQADGVEMQFTKDQAYGLSGQVSFTYQNEMTSVIPLSGSEDFYPTIPAASILLGNIYRVGFLSPFVASFDFSYQTHNGWRINPQTQWNVGYPVSPGLLAAGFINGQPYNVPYTNASGAPVQSLGTGTTDQYVDPMNPGSFFKPNIAATRGIPVTAAAGGKLSHPSSITNLTIEYNAPRTWSAGVDVFNLFNALYGGPSLNSRWQPVATGISGPLTGQNATGLAFPQFGMIGDYGTLRHGRNAFIDTPNGIRSYYFYFTVKM
ncbi:MAG TPA: TonB-dependent receptor, partial [Candidatus Rubrimentiphilum sp.]|nr:TonB-dependent receptor [Candidatus Rubrimentiphilum sp.]